MYNRWWPKMAKREFWCTSTIGQEYGLLAEGTDAWTGGVSSCCTLSCFCSWDFFHTKA